MIYKFSLIEKILLSNDIIPHPFTDAASSVGLGFALGCAVKLKIADHITKAFREPATIAASAGVSTNGCELILDCLCALGYVSKKGNGYAYTKRGFQNLSPESPQNFRHFILFCDYLYKGYIQLDETVKFGHRPQSNMLQEMSEYEWELFSKAMIDISQTNVKEVCGKIPISKSATSMLDLGGSHGLYSIHLCKKNPQLKSTIIDLPPVRKYADECITKHQVANQVSFTGSDFMKNALPKENDIILVFNIIHGLNQDENEHLAVKVYESLKPGGVLAILDQIKNIGGPSQLAQATTSYMALNLLHQAGGKTYSLEEVEQFAGKAGFRQVTLKKLHAPGFGVILCVK